MATHYELSEEEKDYIKSFDLGFRLGRDLDQKNLDEYAG